ncbi:MAG: pyridoxamine 5'-phosphate oxidase family protein [Phycisphaerae bacterium]
MNTAALDKALSLAARVGHVLIATAGPDGSPHLATARRFEAAGDGLVAVREWFCPGTVENLQANSRISIVAWDPASDEGYQVLGRVEHVDDCAIMDGYAPGAPSVPQVQKRLIIRPRRVLAFSQAPHSDTEE